jgi:hypothetical protein
VTIVRWESQEALGRPGSRWRSAPTSKDSRLRRNPMTTLLEAAVPAGYEFSIHWGIPSRVIPVSTPEHQQRAACGRLRARNTVRQAVASDTHGQHSRSLKRVFFVADLVRWIDVTLVGANQVTVGSGRYGSA